MDFLETLIKNRITPSKKNNSPNILTKDSIILIISYTKIQLINKKN